MEHPVKCFISVKRNTYIFPTICTMIMQIFVNFWSILTIIDHKVFVTLHCPLYVIEGFLKAIRSTINSLIESGTLFKNSALWTRILFEFESGLYSSENDLDMLSIVLEGGNYQQNFMLLRFFYHILI